MRRTRYRAAQVLTGGAVVVLAALLIAIVADAQEQGGIIVPPPPPGGDIVFASNRFDDAYEIFTMTVTGAGQTRRTNSAGDNTWPVWSPDGTKIAFVSDRTGNLEIFVMNADGSGQTNISNNADDDRYPSWSPDGTKITFSTYRDGNWEVYVMDPDGGNPVNRTNNAAEDHFPSWSPNGEQIAFVRGDGVWVMNANGGSQAELKTPVSSVVTRPAWKPDGSRIAFNRYGHASIWAIDADGSNQKTLFAGFSPVWSPSGDRIVFHRDGEIRLADEDGGDQVQLTNNNAQDIQPHWRSAGGNGQGLLGDVDCNGVVNPIDAALILQRAAGLINALPCPENADVNQNGQVNSIDAALILQFAAGIVPSLPP